MPQYLIQRKIPNAGKLTPADLKHIAQTSNAALEQLGGKVQWVHSYVNDDEVNCIYRAPNADLVREHARIGGFPADRVLEIRTVIDPVTAESNAI